MRISRFWSQLDALSDAATDQREWETVLGDEFARVAPLLRSTGTLATSMACPSPGGDGCPMRVVYHDDGSIRAICGDRPKVCDDLDLNRDDVTIFGLDRVRLARAVAEAFGLSNIPATFDRKSVFRLGSHDVFAGRGFPVFLTIPGPWAGEDAAPYDEPIEHPGPKLLLTPTSASVPAPLTTVLDRASVARLALHDVITIDDNGRLRPLQPPKILLADLRAQIEGGLEGGVADLAWQLPPDVRWEEIGIRFIADEVINVTFRGETRRFEPDGLGMKSAKDGRPKAVWTYLKAFALNGGRLPVHRANSAETSKHQKQKQALSKALRAALGISGDPLPTVDGEYVARFVTSADDLQQGRQGQSRRNFAGSG